MAEQPLCNCNAEKLTQLIEINKAWHKEFNELKERHQALETRYFKEMTKKLKQKESDVSTNICEDASIEDGIEVLKQQLIIYKEDFLQEQGEKKKLRKQNEELKEQLQNIARANEALLKEKEYYRRHFEHVDREKKNIVEELKRLSTHTPPFPQRRSTNNQ